MRVTALQQQAAPNQAADLAHDMHRLTAPEEMGTLFKAIALTLPDSPAPAGSA